MGMGGGVIFHRPCLLEHLDAYIIERAKELGDDLSKMERLAHVGRQYIKMIVDSDKLRKKASWGHTIEDALEHAFNKLTGTPHSRKKAKKRGKTTYQCDICQHDIDTEDLIMVPDFGEQGTVTVGEDSFAQATPMHSECFDNIIDGMLLGFGLSLDCRDEVKNVVEEFTIKIKEHREMTFEDYEALNLLFAKARMTTTE